MSHAFTRRNFLRSLGLAAGAGLLAACAGSPAPAPAANTPVSQVAATPTTATTKPTAATSAASPTAATGAATPTAQATNPAKSSAKVTGKLVVIQNSDFFPDQTAFLKTSMETWAKDNNFPIDVQGVAGFTGTGGLEQRLQASVQAGNQPDFMYHTYSTPKLHFLDVLAPVTDMVNEFTKLYGEPLPGFKPGSFVDNQWYSVPFLARVGEVWARRKPFEAVGIDVDKDLTTYDKVVEACLAASDPAKQLWGWGMTVNTCGDGNSVVQNALYRYGSHLQDESGELVKFNSPETIAGVNFLKTVYTDKKYEKMLPPGVNSWNDLSNNEAYLAGKIFFTTNAGTMYAKAIQDKNPVAEDTVLIPYPAGPKISKQNPQGGQVMYLIKGAKNADAARDLMRFLLSKDMQLANFEKAPNYATPAYQWGWDQPTITKWDNLKRFEKIAKEPNDFTGLRYPGPVNPAVDAVNEGNVYTEMMARVLQGNSVEQAVKEASDRAVKIFKDFGKKGA